MDNLGGSACTALELRAGDQTAPLFLIAGLGGDPNELAELAGRLQNARTAIGLAVDEFDQDGAPIATVAQMANQAVVAIQAIQPKGPYHIVGYSFGGLIAFAVAQLLHHGGKDIALLVLIGTPISPRYWPLAIWFRSMILRAARDLQVLSRMPIRSAIALLKRRSARLARQLAVRLGANARVKEYFPPSARKEAILIREAAMEDYRPDFYPGKLNYFRPSQNQEYFCDFSRLWQGRAAAVEISTFSAGHSALVRDSRALSFLAERLDRCLDTTVPTQASRAPCGAAPAPIKASSQVASLPPKVLITTTCRWQSTARLALALVEAGFRVEAVCPSGHPLSDVDFVNRTFPFEALSPILPLDRAIAIAAPELIVPCDELARLQLHQLYSAAVSDGHTSEPLRELICRSLGQSEYFATLESRARFMTLARAERVRIPATQEIFNQIALDAWLKVHGYPAVLKADGTSGGQGVIIAHDAAEAARAFATLTAPPSLLRVAKRSILDRDLNMLGPFLRRARPGVSIQSFVAGRPANAAVACWRGEVLGQVCVEALRTTHPTGHATVVRYIVHSEIDEAVRRMVGQMRMSGLCGFDFILSESDRTAYLIEINPRATPTAHMPGNDGRSLMNALYARVMGLASLPSGSASFREIVALFPGEVRRDPHSPFLTTGSHDVPWQSAKLVELGLRRWRFLRWPKYRIPTPTA